MACASMAAIRAWRRTRSWTHFATTTLAWRHCSRSRLAGRAWTGCSTRRTTPSSSSFQRRMPSPTRQPLGCTARGRRNVCSSRGCLPADRRAAAGCWRARMPATAVATRRPPCYASARVQTHGCGRRCSATRRRSTRYSAAPCSSRRAAAIHRRRRRGTIRRETGCRHRRSRRRAPPSWRRFTSASRRTRGTCTSSPRRRATCRWRPSLRTSWPSTGTAARRPVARCCAALRPPFCGRGKRSRRTVGPLRSCRALSPRSRSSVRGCGR
mmetsp:Transcript_2480/g.8821  ORF Transcript_2480/g.8821 Transcript_2480/m.8821 type:complete len:268 (+) Transcript_2480:503-1306(+)